MTATETFQITAEQAELDEQQFVPALVEPWVGPVLDAAGVLAVHGSPWPRPVRSPTLTA